MIYIIFAAVSIVAAIVYEILKRKSFKYLAEYQTSIFAAVAVAAISIGILSGNVTMFIVAIGMLVGTVATYYIDTTGLNKGIALYGVSYALFAGSPSFGIPVMIALCFSMLAYLLVSTGICIVNDKILPLIAYAIGMGAFLLAACFNPVLWIAVAPILLSDGVLLVSYFRSFWFRDLIVFPLFAFGTLALLLI